MHGRGEFKQSLNKFKRTKIIACPQSTRELIRNKFLDITKITQTSTKYLEIKQHTSKILTHQGKNHKEITKYFELNYNENIKFSYS